MIMQIVLFVLFCLFYSHFANFIEQKFGSQKQEFIEFSVIEFDKLNIHIHLNRLSNNGLEFTGFQISIDDDQFILCLFNVALVYSKSFSKEFGEIK